MENYYVVVTAKVLRDKTLSDKEKLMMGLISNLTNKTGICFASNAYLANELNCSISTVKRAISNLHQYIEVEVMRDEKNEVSSRQIWLREATIFRETPQPKNEPTSAQKRTDPSVHLCTDLSPKMNPIKSEYNNKEIKNKIKKEDAVKNGCYKFFVDVWFRYYKSQTGLTPTFGAVEGRHMKQIIQKIKTKTKSEDEQYLSDSFAALLNSISDKWILKNLQIQIINSKLDIIHANGQTSNDFEVINRILAKVS